MRLSTAHQTVTVGGAWKYSSRKVVASPFYKTTTFLCQCAFALTSLHLTRTRYLVLYVIGQAIGLSCHQFLTMSQALTIIITLRDLVQLKTRTRLFVRSLFSLKLCLLGTIPGHTTSDIGLRAPCYGEQQTANGSPKQPDAWAPLETGTKSDPTSILGYPVSEGNGEVVPKDWIYVHKTGSTAASPTG